MSNKGGKLVLPALRGIMGDWVYYACLMSLADLSSRVRYADEVHKNKSLSDMIQRQIKDNRGKQIADYLSTQSERFFNSLVIATYGGQPNWHALSNVKPKSKDDLTGLTEEQIASVGFLTLQGDEQLFALDGQHRLAGIKKAIQDGLKQDPMDEVSVIVVAHKATAKGLERTRRLFTTLNKTAKPVSKGEIIALDEDDVMAVSVRWLIEESKLFRGERIAFTAGNNIPASNQVSLTTIGNLYDVLGILFSDAQTDLKKRKSDLQRTRPSDETLNAYFKLSKQYFSMLGESIPELGDFFAAGDTKSVVMKQRGSHGGSVVFRPIGLDIFTQIVARLTKSMPLAEAVKLAAKLPRRLTKAPYEGLMWDASNKTISNAHNVTVREILLYMLDAPLKWDGATLTQRYRKETGDDTLDLPKKIV